MATQSCCRPCEKHVKQWERAENALDVLRSEVGELRLREKEAIERERHAKDQLHAFLRRAQELHFMLDEVRRENPSLYASLPEYGTNAEPLKVPQETAEMFPQTPAQITSLRPLPHDVPGNAENTVEISTIQEAAGAMAPSSEKLANWVVSEVRHSLEEPSFDIRPESQVETSVFPVIPEVEPFTGISLNGDRECDAEAEGGEIEKGSSECIEPRTQEQGNKHEKEKERPGYETQSTPLEAINLHINRAVSTSEERPANNGSHRKRRRRTLVQASSDEDDEEYEAAPPSKRKLFKAFNDPAASNTITPKIQRRSSSPGSRLAVVGMEFGGGITITEIGTDPEMPGPKKIPSKLKGKAIVEIPAPAPVEPKLRQDSSTSLYEAEDEIESSDDYSNSASVESSAKSSGSSKADTGSEYSPRQRRDADRIDLSDSELGPPLTRSSARAARSASSSQAQGSESRESLLSSSSSSGSDRVVLPKVVNLLRESSQEPEEDSDDDHDDLNGFIVEESSSSSGSDSKEQTFDSDSEIRDNVTHREELVWKRQNQVWDFEGDMLVAIQTNGDIALQAICALYRQQTEEEQGLKSSLHRNGRGFDILSAHRGSTFAEFLIGGDELGQMKRSARAFQTHFPGSLRICKDIAAHHSKQLFEIYSTNEDPFWGKCTGQAT